MSLITLFLLVSLLSYTEQSGFMSLTAQCNGITTNGTTPSFDQIFLGRCFYFLNIQQNSNCDINPANYDCSAILAAFKSAIVGKDPCSVTISDFNKFLSLASHPIPQNGSLFWSGTAVTAHDCMQILFY